MGVRELLARSAAAVAHVLVVEVPGSWLLRLRAERALRERGWRLSNSPADADVLLVCGTPGPALSRLIEQAWEAMPGPRVRSMLTEDADVASELDRARAQLCDTAEQRHDAEQRSDFTPGPADNTGTEHSDMIHSAMEHGSMEHGSMEHGSMEHGSMEHGSMDMSPFGIPLAEGAEEDRDGLEMDVLHVTFGPILPAWPAGLVLNATLHGDVIMDVRVNAVDVDLDVDVDAHPVSPVESPSVSAARLYGRAADLLCLAGAGRLAARARDLRDALAERKPVDHAAAARLRSGVARSVLLRWSLRGVTPLSDADLRILGLPEDCRGDVFDRLLTLLDRAASIASGEEAVSVDAVPLPALPALLAGLEVGQMRLTVAGLALEVLPMRGHVHG